MSEAAQSVVRPEIGDVVADRYELRRDLGVGSTGQIFEAIHKFTGRSVALKLVAANAPAGLLPELHARLAREARALASVRHPGIVEVLDGGILRDGTPFLVLEQLEGRTLEGLLAARGRLALADAVAAVLQLGRALEAAHAVGVVHRDVKPSNVLVVMDHGRREVIKLIDFGIVSVERADERLTRLGALIGTPGYMAPEQLLGLDTVDARSDVYALGIMLFELLSGRPPYEGSYQQVVLEVCSTAAAPSLATLAPDVPPEVAGVALKAMEKSPADRFSSMKEFCRALLAAVPGGRERTELFGPPPAAEMAAPAAVASRRKLPRAPYVTPLRIVMDGITIDGRSEDISGGGTLVVCHQVCPLEKPGTMRFALPIEGHVVTAAIRVKWVRAAREQDPLGPRALGVEFIDPSAEMTASITRYVRLMLGPEAGA